MPSIHYVTPSSPPSICNPRTCASRWTARWSSRAAAACPARQLHPPPPPQPPPPPLLVAPRGARAVAATRGSRTGARTSGSSSCCAYRSRCRRWWRRCVRARERGRSGWQSRRLLWAPWRGSSLLPPAKWPRLQLIPLTAAPTPPPARRRPPPGQGRAARGPVCRDRAAVHRRGRGGRSGARAGARRRLCVDDAGAAAALPRDALPRGARRVGGGCDGGVGADGWGSVPLRHAPRRQQT